MPMMLTPLLTIPPFMIVPTVPICEGWGCGADDEHRAERDNN